MAGQGLPFFFYDGFNNGLVGVKETSTNNGGGGSNQGQGQGAGPSWAHLDLNAMSFDLSKVATVDLTTPTNSKGGKDKVKPMPYPDKDNNKNRKLGKQAPQARPTKLLLQGQYYGGKKPLPPPVQRQGQGKGSLVPRAANNKKSQQKEESQQQIAIAIPPPSILIDVPTTDLFMFSLNSQFPSREHRQVVLLDQLKTMIEDCRRKDSPSNLSFHLHKYVLLDTNTVSDIYFWCKLFGVNLPTFFRALELYDRFYVVFNSDLMAQFRLMDGKGVAASKSRVMMQKPLRTCSCIMLASKIHSDLNSPSITLEKVKQALDLEKKKFSLEAVAESELRVFRVLNYRTHWVTPFDLTEQMIGVIDLEVDSLPRFYSIAMLYLKVTYFHHHEFYKQVEKIIWKKLNKKMKRAATSNANNNANPNSPEIDFKVRFEYNSILRSAAVISAAGFHFGTLAQKKFSNQLAALTQESQETMENMALILCDMAGLGDMTPQAQPPLVPRNLQRLFR